MRRRALLLAAVAAAALLIDRAAVAAVTLRGVANGATGNSTTTAVAIPSGTVAGDVTIIAGVQTYSAGVSWTVPSGWTSLFNTQNFVVAYRIFQTGDPASVTLTSNNVDWINSFSISYTGTDPVSPIDAAIACPMSGFSAYRAPAVAPTYTGGQLLAVYLTDPSSGGTITVPSGLTSRVSSAYGPSGLLADVALSGGTPTPDYNTSGGTFGALSPSFGMSIVLKAAAASGAGNAGRPTWAGLYTLVEPTLNTGFSIPFGPLAPESGDLLLAWIASDVTLTSGPSGWTLQSTAGPSTSNTSLWTHEYVLGDSLNPAWVAPAGYQVVAAAVVRTTGAGANPRLEQVSGSAGGIGTGTATSASLTPAGALDLLWVAFGDGNSTATTWATEPSGLTIDLASVAGPCILVAYQHAAATPTGAYTAAVARTSDTISATAALVTSAAAARVAGGGGVL